MMKFINKKNENYNQNYCKRNVGADVSVRHKKTKIVYGIIIGLILGCSITAFAEYSYLAGDIKYTDNKSVAEALNELYANKKITSDETKSITANGSQTLDKYYKNLNVNVETDNKYTQEEYDLAVNFAKGCDITSVQFPTTRKYL